MSVLVVPLLWGEVVKRERPSAEKGRRRGALIIRVCESAAGQWRVVAAHSEPLFSGFAYFAR
jgi:hypothetical protein